jgi:hypothetical protein
MMSEMEMLYLICKHVIYFLFRKAGGGGGVSMSPYRNKTTPCMGFFFCIPLDMVALLWTVANPLTGEEPEFGSSRLDK